MVFLAALVYGVGSKMITIDGSIGEGGGQILRTALSLALVTGREFSIFRIRAGRERPGLQNQHLAAVKAAATVGQAEVEGDVKGSQQLVFRPRAVVPGEHSFDVGSAGSTTLILQTVLPALMTATGRSALVIEGGTHNPLAPPFEFVAKAFLPLLNRMGPTVKVKLDRHGFFPAGGGKIRVTIEPCATLNRLDLAERGNVIKCRCAAILANLPDHIAERELKVLKRKLSITPHRLDTQLVNAHGCGNVLLVELECANVAEVFVGFGEKGVRAEIIADRLAKEVDHYIEAGVPVGGHLADQLLLPMALAGGGSFVTTPLTEHAVTNIEVIKRFLPIEVRTEHTGEYAVRVEVKRAA